MCGIAGTFSLADREIVRRMTGALAHRGPDDEGIYIDEDNQAALGHRRLTIIDLSSRGRQPMSYGSGRFWITYNGEIYNFADLRKELEKIGYVFNSDSDTEVVLAAYARWGEACLDYFRGMFAFAILDRAKKELFLARDRFGVKPLLYAKSGNIFLFASELKALLASGMIERRMDRQAVWDYLSIGSVPQPRTILRGVSALPAGCWMRVRESGDLDIRRYWDIFTATEDKRRRHIEPEEARRELRRLLDESARLHMIADVPIGAFLSGGVDSTSVAALMSRLTSSPVKTYSIGFETQYGHLNELSWARIAARHLGADHTGFIVTEADVAGVFDNMIKDLDQPSHDGVNTYLVSKTARHGVTVALSGLGGDELFAGYPQFLNYSYWQKLVPGGAPWMPRFWDRFPTRLQSKLEYAASGQIGRLAQTRRFLDERGKCVIVSEGFRADFAPFCHDELYKRYVRKELDAVTQLSYIELSGYLVNTLLRDADAMSMAHSLEVRPVLLDHVLAEYVFSLPASMKLNNGMTKVLFLDAIGDMLPDEILGRKKKMGFELPILEWLKGPWRDSALAALNSRAACFLFARDFLERCSGAVRGSCKPPPGLWPVIVLSAWAEHFEAALNV